VLEVMTAGKQGIDETGNPLCLAQATTDHEVGDMAVARVIEISATAPLSFADVIRQGLERATQTLRGVTAGWPSTTPEGWPGQILDETTASAEAFCLT
jgi:Dodecin